MPDFMFAYHGGRPPESAEEAEAMKAEWDAWLTGLGADAVQPGNPVGMSKTVSADGVADGGGSNPLMGYSIVRAADMDDAIAKAKSCPFVKMGSIEVAEIKEMM